MADDGLRSTFGFAATLHFLSCFAPMLGDEYACDATGVAATARSAAQTDALLRRVLRLVPGRYGQPVDNVLDAVAKELRRFGLGPPDFVTEAEVDGHRRASVTLEDLAPADRLRLVAELVDVAVGPHMQALAAFSALPEAVEAADGCRVPWDAPLFGANSAAGGAFCVLGAPPHLYWLRQKELATKRKAPLRQDASATWTCLAWDAASWAALLDASATPDALRPLRESRRMTDRAALAAIRRAHAQAQAGLAADARRHEAARRAEEDALRRALADVGRKRSGRLAALREVEEGREAEERGRREAMMLAEEEARRRRLGVPQAGRAEMLAAAESGRPVSREDRLAMRAARLRRADDLRVLDELQDSFSHGALGAYLGTDGQPGDAERVSSVDAELCRDAGAPSGVDAPQSQQRVQSSDDQQSSDSTPPHSPTAEPGAKRACTDAVVE